MKRGVDDGVRQTRLIRELSLKRGEMAALRREEERLTDELEAKIYSDDNQSSSTDSNTPQFDSGSYYPTVCDGCGGSVWNKMRLPGSWLCSCGNIYVCVPPGTADGKYVDVIHVDDTVGQRASRALIMWVHGDMINTFDGGGVDGAGKWQPPAGYNGDVG